MKYVVVAAFGLIATACAGRPPPPIAPVASAPQRPLSEAEIARRNLDRMIEVAGENARRPARGIWTVQCEDDQTRANRECYAAQRVGRNYVFAYPRGRISVGTGGVDSILSHPRMRPDIAREGYRGKFFEFFSFRNYTGNPGRESGWAVYEVLQSNRVFVSYEDWPYGNLVQYTFRTEGLIDALQAAHDRNQQQRPR